MALGHLTPLDRGTLRASWSLQQRDRVDRLEDRMTINMAIRFGKLLPLCWIIVAAYPCCAQVSVEAGTLSRHRTDAASESQQSSAAGIDLTARGAIDIRDFGAIENGTVDCTEAIQKAIDATAVKGGVVFIPAGRFLVKGRLLVKAGVHVAGINRAPQSWEPASGSILLATGGRDHEEQPALFEMRSSTSVEGITVYYPEQKVDDVHPYPWTFHVRADPAKPREVSFDSTIQNVTLVNSYNGIRTGPTENGRHRIMGVHGCVLRRGILVDWTGDIGRIENVQFHCHFWAHKAFAGNFNKAFAFMQKNLEAFIFGRTDWEYVTNTFVFPAKIGYHFIETRNGACNGQFLGIGADASETCVVVEALQPQGLLITNGEFNSHRAGRSTQFVVEKNCRGNIRLVNCGFWGPVEHNAVLLGNAYVSFSDCYFSNNFDTQSYALVAEGGKLQIHQCTFDAVSRRRKPGTAFAEQDARAQPPSIHLKQGLQHAIVRGNNGYYGVSIQNDIGGRAIIADNEPWGPPQEIKATTPGKAGP
jgi:hypothetical protein